MIEICGNTRGISGWPDRNKYWVNIDSSIISFKMGWVRIYLSTENVMPLIFQLQFISTYLHYNILIIKWLYIYNFKLYNRFYFLTMKLQVYVIWQLKTPNRLFVFQNIVICTILRATRTFYANHLQAFINWLVVFQRFADKWSGCGLIKLIYKILIF